MSKSKSRSLNLYAGERQHKVFCSMEERFPIGEMAAATRPFQFPLGDTVSLPEHYTFNGASLSSEALIKATDTSALLVLKDGQLRLEQYFLTGGRQVQWTSWSVAKSFISALVGIAIDEGFIASVEDPINRYVPALEHSGYQGVAIKHVLQMSSGVRWNEDYSDINADVHRLGKVMAGEASLEAFVAAIAPDREPGTRCQYNSADTQALGLLLINATGRTLADYMQEKLCEPLGMESRGYWILDNTGVELALGGLNLTARDFAKIGELYRNGGNWRGRQVVPKTWVEASLASGGSHLAPGEVLVGGHLFPFGYGYQWWLPKSDCGEFSAVGVYNQFVYCDPSRGIVIVKLSANPRYGVSELEADNKDEENMAFLQAIARSEALQ
ncbi:MAG: CubicO group peptidase (beta-lactamase class C family) [Paraglaciecola psychrophila]|jgi:CubicO group peptidase (beta-lactamase class C family)